MTGHRKSQGKPLKAVRRAELSRANCERALAAADKPSLRVAAAAGYLRAVLRRAERQVAEAVAARACETLLAEARRAEALTTHATTNRTR